MAEWKSQINEAPAFITREMLKKAIQETYDNGAKLCEPHVGWWYGDTYICENCGYTQTK